MEIPFILYPRVIDLASEVRGARGRGDGPHKAATETPEQTAHLSNGRLAPFRRGCGGALDEPLEVPEVKNHPAVVSDEPLDDGA
jgi:hypothetical protein